MRAVVLLTLVGWGALEVALLARDRARGKGGTTRDQGTRRLTMLAWLVAFAAAQAVAVRLRPGAGWQLGHWHLVGGLVLLWVGLAVRIWAVVALGPAFRTTVEVDAGQAVVDRGPYRWVRHPSYTGMLLISIGAGLTFGNWLSLAILVLLPLAAMLRRIAVEEATLTEVMGEPYLTYQERTRRLVPGLW